MMQRTLVAVAAVLAARAYAIEVGRPIRLAEVARTAYAPMMARSIVADGSGGSVAFGELPRPNGRVDILATPIDAAGTPHPEKAVVVVAGSTPGSNVAAAKTPAGYLVTYRDERRGYLAPLNASLQPGVAPLIIPSEEPSALACDGNVCAAALRSSVLLVDDVARSLGSVPRRVGSLTAVPGQGFAAASFIGGPAVEVVRISRAGEVSATAANIPVNDGTLSGEPAIAPHPFGLAVFWTAGSQVEAAVVRNSGTVKLRALIPVAASGRLAFDIHVAADGAGRYALVFSVSDPVSISQPRPRAGVWGMRLTVSSLLPIEPPTALSADRIGNNEAPRIAATGDGVDAVWNHTPRYLSNGGARALRILPSGPIDPMASAALRPLPAAQTARRIATTGERTLVAWSTISAQGILTNYATLLDRYNRLLHTEPLPLNITPIGVATDGRDFLLSGWIDTEAGPSEARLAAVDGSDGTARLLPFRVEAVGAEIAWDGTAYVLNTWEAPRSLLMRVTPDGVVLWTKPSTPLGTAVAAVPGRTLVTSRDETTSRYEVIDSAGRIVGAHVIPGNVIPFMAHSNRRDEFFVVLQIPNTGLSAMRISADGAPLDPTPVPITLHDAFWFEGRWLLAGADGIGRIAEFPSGRTVAEIGRFEAALETVVAAEQRGVMLTTPVETIDGVIVYTVVIREILETGAAPPRRRTVGH